MQTESPSHAFPPIDRRAAPCGFTLIEMSIVIAVIGIILGAIVTGTSVLHASRLQSVIMDVKRFEQATATFRDKYQYLPGDMPTASTIWPAATNGNGDGFIGDSSANTPPQISINSTEIMLVWEHLGYASLIEGSYPNNGSVSFGPTPGVTAPASKVPGATYGMMYTPPAAAWVFMFAGEYRHIIAFGAPTASNSLLTTPIISGSDALSIDQKMDDGLPASGNVMTYTQTYYGTLNSTTCVNGNSSTAAYITTSSNAACSLIFITGF